MSGLLSEIFSRIIAPVDFQVLGPLPKLPPSELAVRQEPVEVEPEFLREIAIPPKRVWSPVRVQPEEALKVYPTPKIIDIFTSAKDSFTPKKTFFPGDTIQWNIVHAIQPDTPDVSYAVLFLFRHYAGYGTSKEWQGLKKWDLELVYHPMNILSSGRFTYEYPAMITFVSLPYPLPDIGTGINISGTRAEIVNEFLSWKVSTWPWYQQFTAIVSLPDVTGRPYDLRSDWNYYVVG